MAAYLGPEYVGVLNTSNKDFMIESTPTKISHSDSVKLVGRI